MLNECKIVILHIGAHVKVDVSAPIQDVLLGVVDKSCWLQGGWGWGELEEEYNEEKAACSKHLLNAGCHSARHLSFFFGEYSELNLVGRTWFQFRSLK